MKILLLIASMLVVNAKPLDKRQINTSLSGFIGDNIISPFLEDITPGLTTSLIDILTNLQSSFNSSVPLLIGKRDKSEFNDNTLKLKLKIGGDEDYTIENFIDDFKVLLFSELLSILLNLTLTDIEKVQLIQQAITNAHTLVEDMFGDILEQVLSEINQLGSTLVSGTNLSINQIISQIGK
jgi:hypothetical protein